MATPTIRRSGLNQDLMLTVVTGDERTLSNVLVASWEREVSVTTWALSASMWDEKKRAVL